MAPTYSKKIELPVGKEEENKSFFFAPESKTLYYLAIKLCSGSCNYVGRFLIH